MKIAIVGTGISGLVCAHLLHDKHDITLFEANDYVGGHTNTVDVGGHAVDTGFIVFNDWTYPNFIKLLERLGVDSQPSTMSFSVRDERTRTEYNGTSLNALFAQRGNILRPSFHRMVLDILRFNREAKASAAPNANGRGTRPDETLREFIARRRFSRQFVEQYLVPIGASIWSADPARFDEIPAHFFIGFLKNHGMLNINERPQWRVVRGGSRTYVEKLIRPLRDRIRLNSPVYSITRSEDGATVTARGARAEKYDRVIIAAHSDQALRMIADPSDTEREILGAIPYQPNETVLHTDEQMLPRRRLAWAAWNYHITGSKAEAPMLTYNMNILQSLQAGEQFCVTLNRTAEIARARVLRRFEYHHPVYNVRSVAAQQRWSEINGVRNTYFCGAYWGYGFHEDGVVSGLRVCRLLGEGF